MLERKKKNLLKMVNNPNFAGDNLENIAKKKKMARV